MTRFYVGQRVRILWSTGWPELAGQEGRIVDRSPSPGCTGISEWVVAPDCWGTADAPRRAPNGGTFFAPSSRQLEPILPEGHRPAELSVEELLPFLKEQVAA